MLPKSDESYVALLAFLGDSAGTPSKHMRKQDAKTALEEALGRLPPDYETVVRMNDLEGMSAGDVAEAMGRSVVSVYMLKARTQARSPTKRKAFTELITYLTNQDDRLAYDKFRARGLDIGSGRVEAACKHVVGTRMKRSGMCWSRRSSQATLSLRVAWLNERWDELWAQCPLAA